MYANLLDKLDSRMIALFTGGHSDHCVMDGRFVETLAASLDGQIGLAEAAFAGHSANFFPRSLWIRCLFSSARVACGCAFSRDNPNRFAASAQH
jgi:hypothetical protein